MNIGKIALVSLLVFLGGYGYYQAQKPTRVPKRPALTQEQLTAQTKALAAQAEARRKARATQAKTQAKAQTKANIAWRKQKASAKRFVQKLVNQDIFVKVTYVGQTPYVWVRDQFYLLDFDAKELFINTVAVSAYGNPPDDPIALVVIRDARSGKQIGSFSRTTGLRLD